ncbi:hypothetical protein FQN50_004606 [Emmonsiellopsis sp. PD_5]|nr:hypothetical protein FQN50_004606 [Emmonsiellopsis sp. PD_5]
MSLFSSKRQREEDLDGVDIYTLREHKKPRPLPFRTSPTSRHTTLFSQNHRFQSVDIPQTVTPVESSDDEDHGMCPDIAMSPRSQSGRKDDLSFLQIRVQPCPDTDSDLEMTDQPRSSNPISPCSAGLAPSCVGSTAPSPIPHRLITQSLNLSGGRTATPIYGHFTANMNVDSMVHDSTAQNDPPVASSNSTLPLTDGEDWWRRRKLPSPISEDEISPTTPFPRISTYPTKSTDELLASSHVWRQRSNHISCQDIPPTLAQNIPTNDQHNEIRPFQTNTTPPNQNENQNPANWAKDPLDTNNWAQQTTTPQPGTPPPAINDTTPRPTGRSKISIAMGYRADCDKCQRRVPGHYSHIIRA